jgi:hypothetical protein
MILSAKELMQISEDIDKECLEFSKWCLKNIKKAPTGKKYVYKKQNEVVAKEFSLKQILMDFKINKFNEAIKK